MSDKELAVYRLVRAHYLAQFLPHHEFDRTMAQFSCGSQSLAAVGKQIAVTGWREVLTTPGPSDADGEDAQRSQVLPALHAGLSCPVGKVDLKALKTLPPKPYTQGELVKAMKDVARLVDNPCLKQKLKQTTGIGTEATRARTIKGLLDRGYLLKKGRAIRALDAAFTLIDAVPAAIADPGMTAIWEQALDMIDAGQMTLHTFIAKQSAWAALPAVRRVDAPAYRQERRVLVLLALSGLQGHAAGRVPDGPATSLAARQPSRAWRDTTAHPLLQRCARPVCPSPGDGARRSLLHESRPPPFP